MEELEGFGEYIAQDLLGPNLGVLVLPLHPRLGQFDIPVAVGIPDEVVHLLGGYAQLVLLQVLGHLPDGGIQLGEDPLVLQLQPVGQLAGVDGQVHHQEAAGVPDLVGKVAHGLAPLCIEAHVVSRGVAGDQVKAQGVRSVLIGHLQGVDAVAQRLGHLAPFVVPHKAVDEDGVEGRLTGVGAAGEDHPGHPEKDNIVAGDQHVGRIEVLEVLRALVGPAQGGERPQCGGEPGVQHVLLPDDMTAVAMGALGGIGLRDCHPAAVLAGPGGDLVPPPELPGNTPVVDVLHPIGIDLGEALGDELGLPLVYHPQGLLGQGLHLHKPLGRDDGLYVGAAAVAGAHIVLVVLNFLQQAQLLQVGHDGLSGIIAVHPLVLAAVLVDPAAVVQHPDGLQVMPEAHLEVVGVVGGGHFDAAGTELQIHVLVGHDGDLTVHQRQNAGLANQVLIPLVIGVNGHAGVAQHGLGTGCGHDNIAALLPFDGVFQVPEMARLVLVLHLRVGEGGGAVGAPVDDAGSLVDEPPVVEGDEDVADGLGEALVHGEAGPAPIAGGPQLLLLLHDAVSVLGLPIPHPLQELLPAQVVAGEALALAQLLFHLDLGGDAGVIGAGDPQGGVALHPLKSGQNILQGAVHGMAHVELPGNVRGRHHNGKGLLLRVPMALKAAVFLPHLIDTGLNLLGLVGFGKFLRHWAFLLCETLFRIADGVDLNTA